MHVFLLFFRVERMNCSIETLLREKNKKRHSSLYYPFYNSPQTKIIQTLIKYPSLASYETQETIGGLGGYYPHSSARL